MPIIQYHVCKNYIHVPCWCVQGYTGYTRLKHFPFVYYLLSSSSSSSSVSLSLSLSLSLSDDPSSDSDWTGFSVSPWRPLDDWSDLGEGWYGPIISDKPLATLLNLFWLPDLETRINLKYTTEYEKYTCYKCSIRIVTYNELIIYQEILWNN